MSVEELVNQIKKLTKEQIISFITDPNLGFSQQQLSDCLNIVKPEMPILEFEQLSLEPPPPPPPSRYPLSEGAIGAGVGGELIYPEDIAGPRMSEQEALQEVSEQVIQPEVTLEEKFRFFYKNFNNGEYENILTDNDGKTFKKIINAAEKNTKGVYDKFSGKYGTNPGKFWEENHNIKSRSSSLGDLFFGLQQKAAHRNMYMTTARMGTRGPKFQVYSFKNGKWSKPSWKSARMILKEKEFKGKTSKKGLLEFLGLKDLFPSSKFGDCQLPPLQPSSFGYIKRTKFGNCSNDRTYGQLFPLGKYAYVDGLHRGVSSNFSEAFAKSKGLYPPPRTRVKNKWTYNQMQFGGLPGAFEWKNNPEQEAIMAAFGKKKRKRTVKKKVVKKKVVKKKVVKKKVVKKKKPSSTLIKKAIKLGIRVTIGKTTRRYKTEKVLKKQIKTAEQKLKKSSFGSTKKKVGVIKRKKTTKKKVTRSNNLSLKKKKKSCFGMKKTKPNEWGPVMNAYTGRPIFGIPNNQYGYKGTQPVFGGNTGVVGYSGLGSQTAHLLPKSRRNVRKR